jgi:hypothetical protein
MPIRLKTQFFKHFSKSEITGIYFDHYTNNKMELYCERRCQSQIWWLNKIPAFIKTGWKTHSNRKMLVYKTSRWFLWSALNGYLLDNLFFTNLSNPNLNSGDDLKWLFFTVIYSNELWAFNNTSFSDFSVTPNK